METLKGKKVAILVANGFEQVELEKPREALTQAGAITEVVSPEKQTVQGWHHFEKGDVFTVDCSIDEANPDNYDALLLPGGVINPDQLRLASKAIEFIKTMHQQNKPIAAICHGPWTLIDAEVAKGHKLTSWPSLKIDLINAGAEWVDQAVVEDKKLVTSRKPDDIPMFNEAMIRLFQS